MPPPIVPRNMKKIKFLDVDPLEIARQFTIMDSRLFAKITVDECLAKAWPKKFGDKPTPNFTAIADLSNAVSRRDEYCCALEVLWLINKL